MTEECPDKSLKQRGTVLFATAVFLRLSLSVISISEFGRVVYVVQFMNDVEYR